jgi:hypothetical protein
MKIEYCKGVKDYAKDSKFKKATELIKEIEKNPKNIIIEENENTISRRNTRTK